MPNNNDLTHLSLPLWHDPLYRSTVYLILGSLLFLAVPTFYFRNRSTQAYASWASLQSWLIAAPILLIFLGLSSPWPLLVLTLTSIFGAKTFFQMTGMYHRTYFVWTSYVGVITLALAIYWRWREFYHIMPMIFLASICLIPILRNSAKKMIQYIALSLVGFSFLGWSFMHLGWIWQLDHGPYMTIYIIALTEACDNMSVWFSRHFGQIKLFNRITPRRHLEAYVLSFSVTLFFAWVLRFLLPPTSSHLFWIASGLIAAFGGTFGDLTFSVIRRDLGLRDAETFIIGRGDLITIMDRMILVAPIYYYALLFIDLL